MELTLHQKEMLNGKYGKGVSMAMRIQVAIGEGFSASRLVPITRAHVALSAQEADTWFARKLHDAGAICVIPPTVNPGYCLSYFRECGFVDEEGSVLMQETAEVYANLGAVLTYSCTPYLFGNIPRYGEIVSFSETSASIYVNSVIGAKTHREGSASSLCAAVTGYVPEYGMLLDENRFADVHVVVEADLGNDFAFSLLGLTAAKIGSGVPVFTGIPAKVSTEALINLGTQLNVAGVFDKFHIVGITPDAATLEQALGGREAKRHIRITEEDLNQALERYSAQPPNRIDFAMLGCPHYSYDQIVHVESLLGGKPSSARVWIMTSSAVQNLALRTGLAARIEALNGRIVADTCVDQVECWKSLIGKSGVTDSPKCAYYMGSFGVDLAVRDIDTCIRWLEEKGGCK